MAEDVSEQIKTSQSATEARGALLDRYRNYLRMLARSWLDADLGQKVDHSDLVQETLFKAHQKFDQFRGATEPELAGWLRSILARHLADVGRRYNGASRQLARERSLEEALGSRSMAFGSIVSDSCTSPSAHASRRETAVVLADALTEMSEDHRNVIEWISLDELDWREVAVRMQRSENAVRMLWARALKQLRPLLESRM